MPPTEWRISYVCFSSAAAKERADRAPVSATAAKDEPRRDASARAVVECRHTADLHARSMSFGEVPGPFLGHSSSTLRFNLGLRTVGSDRDGRLTKVSFRGHWKRSAIYLAVTLYIFLPELYITVGNHIHKSLCYLLNRILFFPFDFLNNKHLDKCLAQLHPSARTSKRGTGRASRPIPRRQPRPSRHRPPPQRKPLSMPLTALHDGLTTPPTGVPGPGSAS
jgi:hypothetical protein